MKIDPNEPAYPRACTVTASGMVIDAAMATEILAGIYAGCASRDSKGCPDINTMSAIDEAIGTTDALIAALNREKP